MKNIKAILSHFKGLLAHEWYKLSTLCYNGQIEPFLRHLTAILAVLTISACSTIKYIPTNTDTEVHYKDSLVINYKDSLITIPVYKEVYRDYTNLLDTLVLSTSYAESKAYVDTTYNILKGEIRNTKDSIKYVTKIKYVDRVQYKDSIVVKEVPVEVEVIKYKTPRWAWWTLSFTLIFILLLGLRLYFKFK